MTPSVSIPTREPSGPYHDFWLFREGQRDYRNYEDLLGRRDAPVRVLDDVLRYFMDALNWVPTLLANRSELPEYWGLNWYGPTIINQTGGAIFERICRGWAQVLAAGPEMLVLTLSWGSVPEENGKVRPDLIRVSRREILTVLESLAGMGAQAASGELFILHLGI